MINKVILRIGIIFEKDNNGNYVYKSTEVIDNSFNVIKMDAERYSDFINSNDFRIVGRLQNNSNTIALSLDDSLYSILLDECVVKGYSLEESIETVRQMLEGVITNIKDINVDEHGNLVSFAMSFDKEKIKTSSDSRKSEKQVYGKTEKTIAEEKGLPTITEINMSNVNPDQVISNIKSKVIAQDKTVETIVNNIYNNQLIIEAGDEDLINSSKSSILMDGPTGTGKTLIIKEVAKELSLPMIIRSSTMFSAAGYKGEDLIELLTSLLEKTNGNLELAERGIVVLDEFDKLCGKDNSELEMKKAVQQELLTYLSGAKFPVEYEGKKYEFDTSKLTFICLGAFTDLRERKIRENLDEDGYYYMKPEDYIEEGLLREIVGRFSLITATQSLGKSDLIAILNKSSISPLIQLQNLGKKVYNKDIVYDEVLVEKIAILALEADTGARALQTVINGLRDVILTELRNPGKDTIVLTDELLQQSQQVSKRKGVLN